MKNRVNFSKWLIGWTKTYMWTSFHVWSVLFMAVIKPSKWNAKCWLWCNGWNFYMHKGVRVNLWSYDGLLATNIVYTFLRWSIAPWPKCHGEKITVGTYCVDLPLLMCEILTLRLLSYSSSVFVQCWMRARHWPTLSFDKAIWYIPV